MTTGTRILILALVLSVGLAVSTGSSRAQERSPLLDSVRQEIGEIRYQEGAQRLTQILERGHLHAQDMADAYRLGGEIFAALGDRDQSREHFVRWLTLDPHAQLPAGTSPKIATIFEEASKRVRAQGALSVRHSASRDAGTVKVELLVESDPLNMVAGVRVAYGVGTGALLAEITDALRGLRVALDVPDVEWLRMQVIALDEHGNELAVVGAQEPIELAPVDTGGPTQPAFRERRAWYAQWYPYAGLAAGAGGLGAYFVLQSRSDARELSALNAKSEQSTFADARAVEDRGQRNVLLANISFGVAGLATVAAIVCIWRGATREPTTVVTPVLRQGAAGVSVRGAF